jgi:hypothetical protein
VFVTLRCRELDPDDRADAANSGTAAEEVLAGAGYCSAENLDTANDYSGAHSREFFIATGRRCHDDPQPVALRGPIRKAATPKQRMARKLATEPGKVVYARRKVIVESAFGQMSTWRSAEPLLLRGLDGAQGRWLPWPPATSYANSAAISRAPEHGHRPAELACSSRSARRSKSINHADTPCSPQADPRIWTSRPASA